MRNALIVVVSLCCIIPILATGEVMKSAQSGPWNDPATWLGGLVPQSSDSVEVLNGHIVDVGQAAECLSLAVSAGNQETGVALTEAGILVVEGNVQVSAPSTHNDAYVDGCNGILSVGGDVVLIGGAVANRHAKLMIEDGETTVAGSILMNNNRARVSFRGGGTLFIGGDLSGNGVLNPNVGTVVYNGSSPQLVGPYSYSNLKVTNSSGIDLTGNATVAGTLTLADGNINLNSYDIAITPSGSVAGGSASSYISTSGNGALKRQVNITDTVFFPVGTDVSYAPVALQIAEGSDDFSVSVVDSISPSSGNNDEWVGQTWVISEVSPGGNGDMTVAFQWNGSDEGPLFQHSSAACWHFDGLAWNEAGVLSGITGSDSYVATVSSVLTTGSFSVGNTGAPTSVSGHESLPADFSLGQNYPNPFNPSTTIQFSLPDPAHVELKVFNLIGEEVILLVDGVMPSGSHAVSWDASAFPGGVYFYRIEAAGYSATRKSILLK